MVEGPERDGTDVTIVAHDLGPIGGMERQLTELICGLVRAGRRVTVVARRCELPPDVPVRFFRVPGPARPFSIAYPWFLIVGTLVTARRRRGVLHVTGAIVLNRADVMSVHLCHHGWQRTGHLRASRQRAAYRLNARLARVLSLAGERICFPRARTLAGVSEGVSEEVRASFPNLRGRVVTIPNGVNADRFRPRRSRSGDLRAIFVGGEWDGKGLEVAIRALRSAPEWQLDVVGDGDRARFEKIVEDAGVGDRVHFLGRRGDLRELYPAAAAFVLPSIYETFSLVTYEAAACGLPLLATRVSGVEDILKDGVNGWFIRRDPDDLAARLRTLAADPVLRAAMGHAARQAAQGYTWEEMVRRHLEIYQLTRT
jgi:glycosyltransferase involved in cell wall biosynthesis